MATVHWIGAGLSSAPGIRRLVQQGQELVLWNRTLGKAEAILAGLSGRAAAKELNWDQLAATLSENDVVVSMLPASMHVQVAKMCLERKTHFVSTSYVSPEISALHDQAREAGLIFVNEVGLDPGIDHLFAHALMHEYRNSNKFDKGHSHHCRSYCGGVPLHTNDFTYKFSWSPLGVLKALTNEARWIAGGETQTSSRPWKSLSQYEAHLPKGKEMFEAYPNRDSLVFCSEYGFEEDWNLQEFVRGTLRLKGWSEAWRDIFALVESAQGDSGEKRLIEKSDQLWEAYQYDEGEPDRVVLIVELEVKSGDRSEDQSTMWHQLYTLDLAGNEHGTAMARLVSLMASIAAESVLAGALPLGVSPAPKTSDLVADWLGQLLSLGEQFEKVVLV
jgi:saccharopine dehydrogenase-like NADP-dependent oxidoreductase